MTSHDLSRPYDLVLFGATGFTGRLVAAHLARTAGSHTRWAIAGRDRDKLEALRHQLGEVDAELATLPIILADSSDEVALDALVRRTRVMCTTVGPFRLHGTKLVRACARHGTDYCDITGELPFIRQSVDENHEPALRTRTRIVHACGFDSIPFDLGIHMLWDHARRELGEDLAWVKSFVTMSGRGSPGGLERLFWLSTTCAATPPRASCTRTATRSNPIRPAGVPMLPTNGAFASIAISGNGPPPS